MEQRVAVTAVMDKEVGVILQQVLAILPCSKLTFLPTALMASDGSHTPPPPCSAATRTSA